MSRPFAAAVAVAVGAALLGTSCGGGSDESAADTNTAASSKQTLEQLWRAPGEDVAVVPGTSDHAVGTDSSSFLVVDKQSRLIERPTARVWIARGLKQAPYATTIAKHAITKIPVVTGWPGALKPGARGLRRRNTKRAAPLNPKKRKSTETT